MRPRWLRLVGRLEVALASDARGREVALPSARGMILGVSLGERLRRLDNRVLGNPRPRWLAFRSGRSVLIGCAFCMTWGLIIGLSGHRLYALFPGLYLPGQIIWSWSKREFDESN